jgi:hypothetical protein
MVETSARLHFTHQTETPPFVYIYISRTFFVIISAELLRLCSSEHLYLRLYYVYALLCHFYLRLQRPVTDL